MSHTTPLVPLVMGRPTPPTEMPVASGGARPEMAHVAQPTAERQHQDMFKYHSPGNRFRHVSLCKVRDLSTGVGEQTRPATQAGQCHSMEDARSYPLALDANQLGDTTAGCPPKASGHTRCVRPMEVGVILRKLEGKRVLAASKWATNGMSPGATPVGTSKGRMYFTNGMAHTGVRRESIYLLRMEHNPRPIIQRTPTGRSHLRMQTRFLNTCKKQQTMRNLNITDQCKDTCFWEWTHAGGLDIRSSLSSHQSNL